MKDQKTAGQIALSIAGAYGAYLYYLGKKDEFKTRLIIGILCFPVAAVLSWMEGTKILSMSKEEFDKLYNTDAQE